ncbi:hypothetical protein PVT71_09545 [Salipiger sp. H15]|uniref:DUF6538 domain-containing protein n=1 Tax=Alloyangia sp. H15 TaxID=3029062 RepID=A0AAU8ACX3_9RHOB
MSARIRYAYLKGQTWLYRRNYPKEVAVLLGQQALKQSLKTGDVKVARQRAAEVNARYDEMVQAAISGASALPVSKAGSGDWARPTEAALAKLRAALLCVEPSSYVEEDRISPTVENSVRRYLMLRQGQLRHGGFKSVRYSLELFQSKFGDLKLTELYRAEGRLFLSLISGLSPYVGKSEHTRGLSLDALVTWSRKGSARICGRTQRRIWSQVNHWLDWCVYEAEVDSNPFTSVRFEAKVQPKPYAVPTDA